MKSTILIAMVGLALAGTAGASAIIPQCVAGGTMASYQALGAGGCIVADKLFSNFVYQSTGRGNGVAVPNTAVFVTPVVPTGDGLYNPGPGLIFSSNGWFVPSASLLSNSFVDSSFSFTVTVLDPSAVLIDDGTLTLGAFSISGTGFGDITETINPSATQLQVDTGLPFQDHKFFTPVASVSVLKDLIVAVPKGELPGSAQIFSFEEDFSQVQAAPEPAGILVMGSGLVALGFLRRRSSKRS